MGVVRFRGVGRVGVVEGRMERRRSWDCVSVWFLAGRGGEGHGGWLTKAAVERMVIRARMYGRVDISMSYRSSMLVI